MAELLIQSMAASCCRSRSSIALPSSSSSSSRRRPSPSSARFTQCSSSSPPRLGSELHVRELVVGGRSGESAWGSPLFLPVKGLKWWEKGFQPNMKEIQSAQDLADTLLNAGNKLAVVDFFSPGCGGCKALHPKICQFAEMNPDVLFLQVNYEEHKSMCYSLNVHVLPFFRFYRGASGRLCSFSCTNATIKKFKDAMAKHGTERCSLGPAKGLEEPELLALAANKDLPFIYASREEPDPSSPPLLPLVPAAIAADASGDKSLVATGRS